MNRFAPVLLMTHLVVGGSLLASTLEATTSDGKAVVLNSDGTWTFKKEPAPPEGHHDFNKPNGATEVIKSKKGFFELWFNPEKWTTKSGITHDSAEFTLKHTSGDAYAMAIVERIAVPMTALRKIALDNAKAAAPDAKIVLDEERKVNGVSIVAIQIEGATQGIPFKYYGYYWTGKAGTLQVLTYTGQNLFDDFAGDLTELLNGVVITKP